MFQLFIQSVMSFVVYSLPIYIFTRCLRQLAFYSLTLSFRYLRKTTVAFGRRCTTHHHHHSPDSPYCPKINQHDYLSLLVVSSSLSSPSIYVVVQAAAAAAHAWVSVPGTGRVPASAIPSTPDNQQSANLWWSHERTGGGGGVGSAWPAPSAALHLHMHPQLLVSVQNCVSELFPLVLTGLFPYYCYCLSCFSCALSMF